MKFDNFKERGELATQKRKKWKVCAIVLIAVIGLCMVSCRSSEKVETIENTETEESATTENAITVEEKYHPRDKLCGVSFTMWSAEKDGIQYGFNQTCFTKEEAEKYIPVIEQSIVTVREKMKDVDSFSQDVELQVLVLDDVSTFNLSQVEGAVILAKDELENEQYRFPLFLSITHLCENSQSFGAYAYIFGLEYDNERIKEYLSKEENRPVLDLFYPRMSEIYSNSEDIGMFQQILVSLATELIEENGLNAYFEETFTKKTVNDWLDKIGSEIRCDNDNVEYVSCLEFKKDNKYDFHIECENVTYQFEACKSSFESAEELGTFIVAEMKARDAIARYLKDNNVTSPMFDEAFQLNYEIIGDKVQTMSNTESEGKSASIHIYERYKWIFQETTTHELTHAYVGMVYGDKAWMNEGLAEYFSMIIFPQSSRRETFYASIEKAESDAECLWRTNYVTMEGVPENIEDFNMSSYLDGCVIAYWDGDKTLEGNLRLEKMLWEIGAAKKSEKGSELSYWEAESFVEYLMEQSSFETTWNCMVNNMNFEEVYGKTYDELKTEWIQSLREKVLGDS